MMLVNSLGNGYTRIIFHKVECLYQLTGKHYWNGMEPFV